MTTPSFRRPLTPEQLGVAVVEGVSNSFLYCDCQITVVGSCDDRPT